MSSNSFTGHTPTHMWKWVEDDQFGHVRLEKGLYCREIFVEGFSRQEAIANAHLIAAAPRLLRVYKAACSLLSRMESAKDSDEMLLVYGSQEHEQFEKAVKAVEEAT